MPSNGVIIVGIEDYDNMSTDVDTALRKDILDRVNIMTRGRFADVDLRRDVQANIVGFRPDRDGGRRIESERHVVPAYGFGGKGLSV